MTTGTQTLIVIATDGAGNSVQQQLNITLIAAPIVTLTTDVDGDYANGPFTLTFTWNEEVTGFVKGDLNIVALMSGELEMVTTGLVYTLLVTPNPNEHDGVVNIIMRDGAVTSVATAGSTNASTQINVRYDNLAPEFTGETDAIMFAIGSPSGTEVYNAEATDGGDIR